MNKYCVYLTIYKGNKLPPFYIGSTSIDKINSGYYGSVSSIEYKKLWKSEKSKHPELFKVIIISTFETRKQATEKENIIQRKLNVIYNPLYINKQYAIFNGKFGESMFGKLNPMYGKSRPDSSLRMTKNNPMFNPEIVKKVTTKRNKLLKLGLLKPYVPSIEDRKNISNRMKLKNPSYVKILCNCGKLISKSTKTRYHKSCI